MRDTSWKIYQLIASDSKTRKQRETKATCNSKRRKTTTSLLMWEIFNGAQFCMSVYGYIAEKGLLKGKTEQQLPIRNPILALEGTELPYAAKTGNISLKLTQDKTQCFLPPLSGNSFNPAPCRTVEQCQHQPGIQVNSWQFKSCSPEGSSGM